MDKKLIQQYGEEILCYRIRTARQKKRMQYEDFDKQLIRINKKRNDLFKRKRNLGWEPLMPPVQKGWKRFFVLREDVAKSKQAAFFENILKKINTCDWSHKKDFKIKRRRFGRKQYVVKPQKLLESRKHQFEGFQFSPEERQQFHPELRLKKGSQDWEIRYVFNEPWRFVLRVRPNMITRIKKVDSEVESDLAKIGNYLDGNAYDRRLFRLVNGYGVFWKRFIKYQDTNPYKNKPIHEILDLIKNELL